ncbi:MAG: glycosyltransferase family 4 protein [Desulfobacteraceae bacterium]|nr:glycosyltransferase family 4 protein [Desulfobacteraceae bacterium]MBU4000874.1 glycosyltransferase family 4 protein [Pseudomonadota bacterium]
MEHPRPLNICLLSYRSNPHCGGQGVYIKNLSRALKDLGHRVEVLAGPPDPCLDRDIPVIKVPCLDLYNPEDPFRIPSLKELTDPMNFMEWAGVSTTGFPEPFIFGLKAYVFLKNNRHRYDVIHDNQSLSYGLWAIHKFLPTLATIHHPITVDREIDIRQSRGFLDKFKWLRWYSFIAMQKQVSRSLDRIITVSECAKKDIATDFRIPLDRLCVVPNGINTTLFHPVPGVKREKNRFIVTNSADMPLKGLKYLLMAMADLSKTRNAHLVVIGAPKKDSGIVKIIQNLGIGDRITFTGRISDEEFILQYARAYAAVIPSVYEGFGLPVGEAMACGVPVISTTGGALPEVAGDAGILVPPGDAKALARAMEKLMDDPGLAEKLGKAGYERVQAHFTWKKAAEKTVDVYREVISDHR